MSVSGFMSTSVSKSVYLYSQAFGTKPFGQLCTARIKDDNFVVGKQFFVFFLVVLWCWRSPSYPRCVGGPPATQGVWEGSSGVRVSTDVIAA